jgi:hypothetical protein
MLIMLDFFFDKGGLILICLFFLGALSFRVKDCLNNKRNFIISLVINFIVLFLNLVVIGVLFYSFGYFGGYLKSSFMTPLYLQYFYFVLCVIVGLYIFSKFYLFLNKFYLNYLDKGIFSFKRKSGKV